MNAISRDSRTASLAQDAPSGVLAGLIRKSRVFLRRRQIERFTPSTERLIYGDNLVFTMSGKDATERNQPNERNSGITREAL